MDELGGRNDDIFICSLFHYLVVTGRVYVGDWKKTKRCGKRIDLFA